MEENAQPRGGIANQSGPQRRNLPPTPRNSSALNSYVSEPPSTLAMMKTYAQELLQQQDNELQDAALRGSGIPAARLRRGPSLSPRADGVELPPMGGKGPLERPTHFQLDPTIGSQGRAHVTATEGTTAYATSPGRSALRSSIGWATTSPGGSNDVVLEHRVAGDLIMPARTVKAAKAAAGPPALRRRPLLRTSTANTDGGPPSVAGTATRSADAHAAAQQHKAPPGASSSDGSDAGGIDDMASLDYDAQQQPWWKRKTFWMVAGPLLVSFGFLLAGIMYLVFGENQKVGQFQLWRLCFFIAGLPIIWWIGRGSMDLAVWAVERTLFTHQNALYYFYAIRRPMANVLRAGLVTLWWFLIMTAFAGDMNSTLKNWYENVLRLWGCLTLFMTANLLKVLFAKMLSSKFNAHSHYEKMHQALKREHLLHLMLEPRQRFSEFEELGPDEEEGGGEGACKGDDDGMLRSSHSAPLSLKLDLLGAPNALSRLFRRSAQPPGDRQPPLRTGSSKRLKDRVMFWRASQENLLAIHEEAEEEAQRQQQEDLDQGLPPHSVAVDIDKDTSVSGRGPRHPPPLYAAVAPPAVRTVPDSGFTPPSSLPSSPGRRAAPSPSKPPLSPLTKLERLRSNALEAAGVEQGGQGGQGVPSTPRGPASVPAGRGVPHISSAPRPPTMQRSASVASGRSGQPAATAATPPARKPVLLRRSSSSGGSSSSSNKQLMALRMSRMEKYIRKHTLEVTFKDALSRTERSEQVTTELEARKLGFYLFHNVKADYDRDTIILEDLEEFLSEKDARAAMDMLDEDDNKHVNVQECCTAVARVFLERRNLAASLKDARTIVGTLETLIGCFLHLLMAFLYLVIWNVDVLKAWAGFASLFLGFSFIFGNSIRTTYENVVFLFVVHPYDVGESVWIDNEQHLVEEVHLSFTVLTNTTGQRVWYPNENIRVKSFINLSTSGFKGEAFKVLVDLDTPLTAVEDLRLAAEAVIKANPKEFSGALAANLAAGSDPLKMAVSIWWQYSHNGVDLGRTGRNRTKMYAALAQTMMKAGIRYTWPSNQPDAGGSAALAAATGLNVGGTKMA
ncbi:hypothetical protein D9Q98_000866 [Chlorella vulgaris]|uniref:EF-hand domain-containing protein n=1 Tax=Chlorella vulgaris TaxID=3077 RepID=A0A9D4TZH2_CHLVU|nr:hypothetical protein D9Q98_000866 [Chlorella vulgaris]